MSVYSAYHAEKVDTVIDGLTRNLKELIPSDAAAEECAAIFDLDDTLFRPVGDDAYEFSRPINSVCRLYNECVRLGISVYIVTAREKDEEQLRNIGNGFARNKMLQYAHVFMMEKYEAPAAYKSLIRNIIKK
eukprot:6202931-Pleurochrysis_carterae.AAC.3